MKYIAWKHDPNCYDRLIYFFCYSVQAGTNEFSCMTTSFRERAREFEEYPKDVEEKGFTIQEVFE